MWLRGNDFRPRPLIERKPALAVALERCARVRYADHFEGSCRALWQLAIEMELEGIVAKDAHAPYSAGSTTRWQKVKTPAGEQRERQRGP